MEETGLPSTDCQLQSEVRTVFLVSAALLALLIVTVLWRHEVRYRAEMAQLAQWNQQRSKISSSQQSYTSDSSNGRHSGDGRPGYLYLSTSSSPRQSLDLRRASLDRAHNTSFDLHNALSEVQRRKAAAAAAAARVMTPPRRRMSLDVHRESLAASVTRHRQQMLDRHLILDRHRHCEMMDKVSAWSITGQQQPQAA